MFKTLFPGKLFAGCRLKRYQWKLMTTINPLPINWQGLIFQRPKNHFIVRNSGV
jgi:hypothetical protein